MMFQFYYLFSQHITYVGQNTVLVHPQGEFSYLEAHRQLLLPCLQM
jgi:hypothetical protein